MEQNQIILQGIGLETLIDRFREVVQLELKSLPIKEDLPSIGGLDHVGKSRMLSKFLR